MPVMVCVEELEIDLTLQRVRVANQDIRLGKKERALLELLVRNANQILTHRQLLAEVWGERYGDESKYLLHMLVRRLREKLGDIPPRYIVAVADIGYRFVAPTLSAQSPVDGPVVAMPSGPTTPYLPAPSYTRPLPTPPTSFVGRELERAELHALLQHPVVRLVTLSGSGGTGKTRLALEVARDLIDTFPNGVVFVPLAALASARMVVWTIAQALGVHEHSDQAIETTLQTVLRDKQLLLILDNFEHMRAAAPSLAELLAASPALKLLITSRALLHISGEHEYPVAPLALPEEGHNQMALDTLSAFSAITLFVERGRAAEYRFQLTGENAPAIAAICRRLDGLPLAIELIVARLKFFAPQAILARLQQSVLALLTSGSQDLPSRHQTLRASITWSYDLLATEEQVLFRRIGVFADGCTIAAAEAVCNVAGDLDVLAGLVALANHSLVQQRPEADGEPRFFLLETIGEYALEQLAAHGERAELEQRYADYYVALAEQAEPELEHAIDRVQEIEREYNNLRAVLEWSVAQARRDIGMRLSGALWRFWDIKGYISEGCQWFGQILNGSDVIAPAVRAKAFDGAGVLAIAHGQYTEAQRYHEMALQLYRALGYQPGIAKNLVSLGHVRLYLRDYEQALAFYESALIIYLEMDDRYGISISLSSLGNIAFFQGDLQKAQEYMEETLHIGRAIGNIPQTVTMLSNLAALAYYQKQFGPALRLYQESLSMSRQLGRKRSIATCLEGVALILAAKNNLAQASTLFGAARQVRETTGFLAYNQSYDVIRRAIEEGQQRLGDAWEVYWNEGKRMTVEQIVSDVLSLPLSDA